MPSTVFTCVVGTVSGFRLLLIVCLPGLFCLCRPSVHFSLKLYFRFTSFLSCEYCQVMSIGHAECSVIKFLDSRENVAAGFFLFPWREIIHNFRRHIFLKWSTSACVLNRRLFAIRRSLNRIWRAVRVHTISAFKLRAAIAMIQRPDVDPTRHHNVLCH